MLFFYNHNYIDCYVAICTSLPIRGEVVTEGICWIYNVIFKYFS